LVTAQVYIAVPRGYNICILYLPGVKEINSENSEKQIKKVKRRVYFGFVIIIAVMAASVAAGMTALRVLKNAVDDLRFEYTEKSGTTLVESDITEEAAVITDVAEPSKDDSRKSLTAELRLGELSRLLLSVMLSDAEGEVSDLSGTDSVKTSFAVNNSGMLTAFNASLQANGTQLLAFSGITDKQENIQYAMIPEFSSSYVRSDSGNVEKISGFTEDAVGFLLNTYNIGNTVKAGIIKLLYSASYTSREAESVEAAGIKEECSVITFDVSGEKSGEIIKKASEDLQKLGINNSAISALLAAWHGDNTFKMVMNSEGKLCGYSFANADGSARFFAALLEKDGTFGLEAELVCGEKGYKLYGNGSVAEVCMGDLVLEGGNKLLDIELNSLKSAENAYYIDAELCPSEYLAGTLAEKLNIPQFTSMISGYTLRSVIKGNCNEFSCEASVKNGESIFADISVFAEEAEAETVRLPQNAVAVSQNNGIDVWASEVNKEELAKRFSECGVPREITEKLFGALIK